jgi:hypothetical protein
LLLPNELPNLDSEPPYLYQFVGDRLGRESSDLKPVTNNRRWIPINAVLAATVRLHGVSVIRLPIPFGLLVCVRVGETPPQSARIRLGPPARVGLVDSLALLAPRLKSVTTPKELSRRLFRAAS